MSQCVPVTEFQIKTGTGVIWGGGAGGHRPPHISTAYCSLNAVILVY